MRISALEEQKAAIDRLINERLLAAEAAKRGVTPDELKKTEVKAKIKNPNDGFEEWQLQTKFDRQLREGHTIHLLFDIPRRPSFAVDDRRAPAKGSNSAKVTLVEFGDFECPPCGKMWPIVEQALEPFGDRARYVFRQNPLTFHPRAWKAAEAALAAHAQGKFFPYAQILFANQNALDVPSLKKYAREAGLDAKRFDADLDSGRFAADVAADKHAGQRAGVLGTPMFFINGVQGGDDVYSLEGMRAALEAALK
jgi:protein-disulfide isomerase